MVPIAEHFQGSNYLGLMSISILFALVIGNATYNFSWGVIEGEQGLSVDV